MARLLSLLLACPLLACQASGNLDDDDSVDEPTPEDEPCGDPLPIPVDFTLIEGFTGAEDFAFDFGGWMVSGDSAGNLVRINRAGETQVIAPNVGSTAGLRFLPDGDIVIADVGAGALVRITPEGGMSTVLSGLAYPNGVDVDMDGFVYVAEQDAGQVRRIDPDTGEFSLVGTSLNNPNGLTFDTTYDNLYVGSFGGGSVHRIERDGAGGWNPPVLHGSVFEGIDDSSCQGLAVGDPCFLDQLLGGVGACSESGDGLTCQLALDYAACEDKAWRDPCTTSFLGSPVDSVCARDDSNALFCSTAGADRVSACFGDGFDCTVGGDVGWCYLTWEGINACVVDADWNAAAEACAGLELGAECLSDNPIYPVEGTCTDLGWKPTCEAGSGLGGGGGLDGINTDSCDNVYVTEFVTGVVWRFDPEGGAPRLVAETGVSWIPNMHWGLGEGGFDADKLYISDRDNAGLVELDLGIGSRERPYYDAR